VRSRIPFWLAAHEAGHAIARLHLVAAWRRSGLDDPQSISSIRVSIENGQPRGLCKWGPEPLSFRYQGIISVAGPVAEARARRATVRECLLPSADYDIILGTVRRGWVSLEVSTREAEFIVRRCWRQIVRLARLLQSYRELNFPQLAKLMHLKHARCVYDAASRPDTRF